MPTLLQTIAIHFHWTFLILSHTKNESNNSRLWNSNGYWVRQGKLLLTRLLTTKCSTHFIDDDLIWYHMWWAIHRKSMSRNFKNRQMTDNRLKYSKEKWKMLRKILFICISVLVTKFIIYFVQILNNSFVEQWPKRIIVIWGVCGEKSKLGQFVVAMECMKWNVGNVLTHIQK